MKRKIYDLVKQLLTDHQMLRNSDKILIWAVLVELGLAYHHGDKRIIDYDNFMKAPNFESIRRCRQKIQELHPELRSSKQVQKEKDAIAKQKGTHIFRETVQESMV